MLAYNTQWVLAPYHLGGVTLHFWFFMNKIPWVVNKKKKLWKKDNIIKNKSSNISSPFHLLIKIKSDFLIRT